MAAPRIDVGAFADGLEKWSPSLSRSAVGKLLGWMSPFNGVLGAKLVDWSDNHCRFRLPNRRRIRNHLGGIHAGALVTLGESVAGLLLLKTFSFKDYRVILKDLNVDYSRQGRGVLTAETTISDEELERIRAGLAQEAQFVPMTTRICREDGEEVAVVRTNWQLKAWDQVRKPSAASETQN